MDSSYIALRYSFCLVYNITSHNIMLMASKAQLKLGAIKKNTNTGDTNKKPKEPRGGGNKQILKSPGG